MNRSMLVFAVLISVAAPQAARAQDKPSKLSQIESEIGSFVRDAGFLVESALGFGPAPTVADLPKNVADWPEEYHYLYEERAGIMEFDGGADRASAEKMAEQIVRDQWKQDNQSRGLPADISKWPAEYRYLYEERAGIMEYDGGLSRADAEARAQVIVRDTYLTDVASHPAPVVAAPLPKLDPADLSRMRGERKGPGINQILDRVGEDQRDESGKGE